MALSKFKKVVIGVSVVTIMFTSFSGCSYKIYKDNPFTDNEITASEYIVNKKISKAINDAFEYQFQANISIMTDNEKKAYLLLDAINNNNNLTEEEKKQFTFLLDEFKNNEYLEYEDVYKRLKNLNVERDVNFSDTNILEQYDRKKNVIRISKIDEEKYPNTTEQRRQYQKILGRTTHDGCHSTRINDIKPGEEWLEEAYCSIVDAEATGSDWDYKLCTNTIRFLCEVFGREKTVDKIREARQVGDIEILTNFIETYGVPRDLCEELYEVEEEYKELTQELSSNEVKEKRLDLSRRAAHILSHMYDAAKNNPATETYIIRILLNCMFEDKKLDLSLYKFYYFNSKEQNNNPRFYKIQGDYVIYYEDNVMYQYKINGNDPILLNTDYINERNSLDKALNYKGIFERN